jgi:hypothetical protein
VSLRSASIEGEGSRGRALGEGGLLHEARLGSALRSDDAEDDEGLVHDGVVELAPRRAQEAAADDA